MFAYIEDILHYYVDTIVVNDKDYPILMSISKQCKKGVALTDRQYELVKNKLEDKNDVLLEHNIVLKESLEPRLPLREIDRSKYIKLVGHAEMLGPDSLYESYKDSWQWFKVRFPFSKKDIVKLEKVISKTGHNPKRYMHVKGSHEHYFRVNPLIAYMLVEAFKNSKFEIEDEILEYAAKTKDIIDTADQYVPMYKNNEYKNIHENVIEYISNDESIARDRHIRFGYTVELDSNPNSLIDQVVNRKAQEVLANPANYNMNNIAEALHKLDRYPIVVVVDNDKSYEQVKRIYQAFDMLVPDEQQSVLFRVESSDTENVLLNDFVKSHNLNNWVDNTTKIVYIKKNKLPKVLLNSGFRPFTALGQTSLRSNTTIRNYITFNCDLIVYNDDTASSFSKFNFF